MRLGRQWERRWEWPMSGFIPSPNTQFSESPWFERCYETPAEAASEGAAHYFPKLFMNFVITPEPSSPGGAAAAAPLVLLVDDDATVRRMTSLVLQRAGYDVVTAENAAFALQMAEENAGIRVVITDVVMPHMNGVELAEQLRAIGQPPAILFYSGHPVAALNRDGFQIDPGHFLAKPVNSAALCGKLRELIGRTRYGG